MEAQGHTITYDWTKTGEFEADGSLSINPEKDLTDGQRRMYAMLDYIGARDADAVVLLAVDDMCGAWMECGMALGAGKPVFAIGWTRWTIFKALPQVWHYESVDEFLDWIRFADTPEPIHALGLNNLRDLCHRNSARGGWWNNPVTGEPLVRNRGEMLMLMVSEIAEAMEGERKGLMDDKLPHRPMAEVELADCIIRICDYAGGFGYDLEGAVREKLAYNSVRPDHKLEARLADGGKKF